MAEGGIANESRPLVEASLNVGKYPPPLAATVEEDSNQVGDMSTQEEVDQTDAPICGICLIDWPRLSHVIEECGHVFCEDCLSTHCHYAMEQGTWIIQCAGSGCDVNISADVLWAVLDTKTFRRQQKKAEEQETERRVLAEEREVDWCPHCRGISRVSSEVYSGGRRRADCEKCAHAFCTRCRDLWHGRLGQCSHRVWKNFRTSSRVTVTGETGSDGMEGWEERVKGRKKNDALSNKLIMDTTTPCPKCHVAIYRTTGCNNMFCVRCRHSFCYDCGASSGGCRCHKRRNNQEPPILTAIREILKVDPAAFDRAECAACPACHRMNRKRNTDNHIRCVVCKTSYCFTCKQRLTGNVGSHYKKGMPCVQHTPANSTITSADVVSWCQDMYGSRADGLIKLIKPGQKRWLLERHVAESFNWQKRIYDVVKAVGLELEEKAVKERMENVRPGDVVTKINVILEGNRIVELYSN
ncbi:putative E3 ubiquitin-protein ligase ariadne-2 [Branchiostoma floridae x Branchiostoma japonicum]